MAFVDFIYTQVNCGSWHKEKLVGAPITEMVTICLTNKKGIIQLIRALAKNLLTILKCQLCPALLMIIGNN